MAKAIIKTNIDEFLTQELEDQEIVYIDKDYVYHVVEQVLEIERKSSISLEKINNILDNYLKDHVKSKTVINNIKDLINK